MTISEIAAAFGISNALLVARAEYHGCFRSSFAVPNKTSLNQQENKCLTIKVFMKNSVVRQQLMQLEAGYPQFHFRACVADSNSCSSGHVLNGRAVDIALAEFPVLKGWRVYLCGNSEMVRSTQMQAFIAGAALDEIHADPFDFE